MNILLINPNQFRVPFGPVAPVALDYLAGSLRAAGHAVKIADLCFESDRDLFRLVGDFRADVTGITLRNVDLMSPNLTSDFLGRVERIVHRLRRAGFEHIVLGGAGFSVMPLACLKALPEAEYGVVGEGEVAFVRLLDEIGEGKRYSDTPGVMYRTETGEIVANP